MMIDHSQNTTCFEYDGLHRLTREWRLGANYYDHSYGYDSVGNRIWKDIDGEVTDYIYNEINQLVSSGDISYTYDDNGNLLGEKGSDTEPMYDYNQLNQMVMYYSAAISYPIWYYYDAEGNRVYCYNPNETNKPDHHYSYDNGQLLLHQQADYGAPGGIKTYYTVIPKSSGQIVSSRVENPDGSPGYTDYFYHYDGEDNVQFLTNSNASTMASYLLDSFGNLLNSQGDAPNRFLKSTQEFEPAVGVYASNAGMYSSANNTGLNPGKTNDDPKTIKESDIPSNCSCDDLKDPEQISALKSWKKEFDIAFEGSSEGIPESNWTYEHYVMYTQGRIAYGATICPLFIRIPKTIYYDRPEIRNPKQSCCNLAMKEHEKIHRNQCRSNILFPFLTWFSRSKWTEIEEPAYQDTYSRLEKMLGNNK